MLTINDMPSKLELTCTVTGVKKVWTVKACMLKAVQKFGSLEAFMAQYTAKGAGKTPKVKASFMKPILQAGVEMGKMSSEEYAAKYPRQERTYAAKGSDVITTVCVE